jgi:hypothetical protein
MANKYDTVNADPKAKKIFDQLADQRGATGTGLFSALIEAEVCGHPGKARVAMTATYREDGQAINALEPEMNITVRGFYCIQCKRTIFPAPLLFN